MKISKTDIKICDNVYYNAKKDTCIVVYEDYVALYSERISGTTGKLPFCYNKCEIFEHYKYSKA